MVALKTNKKTKTGIIIFVIIILSLSFISACSTSSDCNAQAGGVCDVLTNECYYCTGSTPHYSITKKRCVECNVNSNCNAQAGGNCDVLTKECHYCSGDTPYYDLINGCVECQVNSNCNAQAGGVCDVLTNECYYCTGSTPHYSITKKRCVECNVNSQCSSGLICDILQNICVECWTDSNCVDGVCDNNVCVGCKYNFQCGDGEDCINNNCISDSSCIPRDCITRECGMIDSGCGEMDCGSCPSDQFCDNGLCYDIEVECDYNQKKDRWCEGDYAYSQKCEDGQWVDFIDVDCSYYGKTCGAGGYECVEKAKAEEDRIRAEEIVKITGKEIKTIEEEKVCEDGEVRYYNCPNGMKIIWCQCLNNDWNCIISPESQCEQNETCSGCLQKDICYQIGQRISIDGEKKYCHFSGTLEGQKNGWRECNENYECKSNLCLEGECTDVKGLVEKASEWGVFVSKIICRVASLFGIEKYDVCMLDRVGVNVSEENI